MNTRPAYWQAPQNFGNAVCDCKVSERTQQPRMEFRGVQAVPGQRGDLTAPRQSASAPAAGTPPTTSPDSFIPDLNSNGDTGSVTMRDVLRESIGYYVISQHLLGTSGIVYKEGLLVRVESNCFILFNDENNTYTVCDYFSLKFFQRYPRNERPAMRISEIMRDFELARAGYNTGGNNNRR